MFDWDGIKDTKFPVYPEGQYHVQITGVDFIKQKSNGNDLAKLTGTILDEPYNGCEITTVLTITEKAVWKVKVMLKACGVEPDERHKRCELMSIAFKNLVQLAIGKISIWDVSAPRKNSAGFDVNDVKTFLPDVVVDDVPQTPSQSPSDIAWEE